MKLATLAILGASALLAVPAAAKPPTPPMLLPGDATVSAATADTHNWIVGARPTAAAKRIARRYGARSFLSEGTAYLVSRQQARPFAAVLRRHHLLSFAEPNWRARRSAFPQDPAFAMQAPLTKVVNPALTPPPVTAQSPLLAVNDAQIDATHPEFSGTQLSLAQPTVPVTDLHGTAVASVAGAAANGVGMVGVWPGMRMLGIPNDLTCAGDAAAVNAADKAGAAVINMSYGGSFCFAESIAIDYAFGNGAVPVAAGGNDFDQGNRPAFPASDPHVLTIAATDPNDQPAFFSTQNAGIDVSAPGVGILVAVPPALDTDGNQDGYQVDDGTSFSAPMVSAAAAWLMAARPGLKNDQYMNLLRFESDDLGNPGYDPAFGYGRVDLAKALVGKPFPHDFGEPNDDIPWVNGTLYKHPDPTLISKRARKGSFAGFIDAVEDPADVFRVWLPAHGRLRLRVTAFAGGPEIAVFSARARTIYSRKGKLGLSDRPKKHVQTLVIRNRGRRAKIAFVGIGVSPHAKRLDAIYGLSLRKLKG
jgi:hypothetical protein